MQDVTQKLLAIREKRKRWQSKLTRATNMLARLHRQEARLTKPVPEKPVAKPAQPKPPVSDVTEIPVSEFPIADTLDIEKDLKRIDAGAAADARVEVIKKAKGPVPGPKLADILDPAAVANRLRMQRLDAKRRGYRLPPKIDKTAMPLTGREALKAIKKK